MNLYTSKDLRKKTKLSEFKSVHFEITEDLVDQRLDKVLGSCPDVNSRSQAIKLIKDGLVSLKGKKMKASKTTLQEKKR